MARRGYAVGSAVLEAVLPPHDGPTVTIPVTMADDGLAELDGIEADSHPDIGTRKAATQATTRWPLPR